MRFRSKHSRVSFHFLLSLGHKSHSLHCDRLFVVGIPETLIGFLHLRNVMQGCLQSKVLPLEFAASVTEGVQKQNGQKGEGA